ncbi:MAG: mechanosensitive ion channel [Marinilabiliaceae bacterium]|nr:mechanosensitive ion channel [Marinilabiliaceae bacterium]
MNFFFGLKTQAFFKAEPTLIEWFISLSILIIVFVLWYTVKFVLKKLIRRVKDNDIIPLTKILILSSHRLLEFFFLLIGMYLVIYYLPFTDKLAKLLLRFFEVAFIFISTVYIARVGTQLLRKYQAKQYAGDQSTSLFEILLKILIFIIGGLIILQSLGISITPLLTALGVGGLAVALALQETLSNLFAGLQIIAAKNIQSGDYVQLESGDEGYIVDIGWRSTVIKALPNRIIIIPNGKLSTSTVKNFSKPDLEIAVLIDVGVSYTCDLEKVEQVTVDVAKEIMQTVDGGIKYFDPFIRFHTFDAYSINFSVIMRANRFVDQYLIKHEFVKLLHKRYMQENIEIPFPITTVFMNKEKSVDKL